MKMEIKYQFNDYSFAPWEVFYEGKILVRTDLVKHLNYWYPEYDWDLMNMQYSYSELARLLHACLLRAEYEYGVQQG